MSARLLPDIPEKTAVVELTVTVAGGHLWADDTGGGGPALVLLHSGWGDSSIWLPMLDTLPPRYRVIRYDTRGYGKSPAPGAPFTQLGDLVAVLDHCGVAFFRLGDHERPDPPAYGRLGQVQAPAAIVIGDRDYRMVIRCAEDLAARIPGCQRIAAAGADHMLPLRFPGQLAELVDKLDRSAELPTEIFPARATAP